MKQKIKDFLSKYRADIILLVITLLVSVIFGRIFMSGMVAACCGTLALCAITLAFKKEGLKMPMAIESGIIGIIIGILLTI